MTRYDDNRPVPISPPVPDHAPRDTPMPARARDLAAEQARARVLLRFVSAQIEVLTAEVTLADCESWLRLRPTGGVEPPAIDLEGLLRGGCADDEDAQWARVRQLIVLQGSLRRYLGALPRST